MNVKSLKPPTVMASLLSLISKGLFQLRHLRPTTRHFSSVRFLRALSMMGFAATLIAQNAARHREFSANLLMRMGTKQPGIGARMHVKEDNLYLEYPNLDNHRRIPFWFLGNGLVATVKEGVDEEFNPGPANPFVVGFLLRFRPTSPDRFCEEFSRHYIEMVKASDDQPSDEVRKEVENPGNVACEPTGQETVAQRACRSFRFAGVGVLSESWTTISFDPKLAAILQIRVNPPNGLSVRLDDIQEAPQLDSLFVPSPGYVVVVDLKKPAASPRK